MDKKTLEWLKDNTHILKIQMSNIDRSRETLFADKSDEWIDAAHGSPLRVSRFSLSGGSDRNSW